MRKAIIVLIIALSAATLFGQPGHPPDRGAPPPGMERDKLRERIEMLRTWKLVEMLNLTQEQSIEFFPLYNTFESEQELRNKQQGKLLDRLEKHLDGFELEEKTVSTILDSLIEIKQAQYEAELEFYEKASEVLTIEQQAAFALFRRKFAEEVKNIIDAGRGHGMPRPENK